MTTRAEIGALELEIEQWKKAFEEAIYERDQLLYEIDRLENQVWHLEAEVAELGRS